MKRVLILSGILICALGGILPVVGEDPPQSDLGRPATSAGHPGANPPTSDLAPFGADRDGEKMTVSFRLQHTKAPIARNLLAQAFAGAKVEVHEKTNSLIVSAPKNLLEKISAFLNLLEARDEPVVTWEFHLRHSKAKSLQSLLAQTFAGVKVLANEKTNSLILNGTANEVKKVRQFLNVLDSREDDKQERFAVPRRTSQNGNAQPAATGPMRGDSSDAFPLPPPVTAAPFRRNAAPAAGPVAKEKNPDEFVPRTAPEYADGLPAQAPATLVKPEARVQDSQPRADNAVPRKDARVPFNDPVHIVRLNHVPAREMRERLKSLFPDSTFTIEADERSNSLLFRGPLEVFHKLDRIVEQLDGFAPPTANLNFTPFMLAAPRPTNGGAAAEPWKGAPSSAAVDEPKPENIRKLRRAYDEHEERARQTAATILATAGSFVGVTKMAKQKPELRQQVAAAFEARQELQRAELDWHRQRLARIEQQIAQREPIKDQVIDRRVDELLNPNLQWDPSKSQAAPAFAGPPARGTTPASGGRLTYSDAPAVTITAPAAPSDSPALDGGITVTAPPSVSATRIEFKRQERQPEDPFQSEQAEKEQRTRKNLQLLALAMHNYHDVRFDGRSSFPPAVVMGSARSPQIGKTPHSWRVELLPFVGALDLYQQYRWDEPWDGPNNKKLIERMPDVFRSPYDDPKSTNSSYFVLVGPGTVFDPGLHGVRIADIIDGTSNTLLLVEAKRNIPWTKPEDIPFDPDKPLPELGGFVNGKLAAAMADGSVRIFDREKVDSILKWMILRNDGHPIMWP